MKKTYRVYLLAILPVLAVAVLGAMLTKQGLPAYEQVLKPSLTPPSLVFSIVWPLLYLLMAISSARIRQSRSPLRRRALALYGLQLVANLLWTVLFFGLGLYGLAALWLVLLWALVGAMIVLFSKIDRTAALLQVPYWLWLTFASYLNISIWLLNR